MYNNTNHLQEKNQIIGSYGLVFMKTVLKLSGRPSYCYFVMKNQDWFRFLYALFTGGKKRLKHKK